MGSKGGISRSTAGVVVSALAEEIREAVRQALREELPALLAELRQPQASGPERLLDVNEAALLLGLSASTVYKRGQRGDLPSVKDGSRVLFRPADVNAYAEARRRSPERVRKLAAGEA